LGSFETGGHKIPDKIHYRGLPGIAVHWRCRFESRNIISAFFRPKRGAQLLARNHFSFRLQKHAKYLERLFLDGYTHAVFSQPTSVQIDFVSVEAPNNRIGTVGDQMKPRFVCSILRPPITRERGAQFTSAGKPHVPLTFWRFTINSPLVH
jgi:hypothetical protein